MPVGGSVDTSVTLVGVSALFDASKTIGRSAMRPGYGECRETTHYRQKINYL
jgi:hypothetical protein